MAVVALWLGACGGGGHTSVDASHPGADASADATPDAAVAAPIEGGGMRGGPIAGELTVFVIDDIARTPIANATVTVGAASGATDAQGRFVVTGVTGAQTVFVQAAGHVPQLWIGVAAREATMDLEPDPVVTPQLPTVLVTFPDEASNNIAQPFASALALDFASFTPNPPIVVPNNNDADGVELPRVTDVLGMGPLRSTCSVIAWVTSGMSATPTQVGLALGMTANGFAPLSAIAVSQLATATIDYGTPPAGMTLTKGVLGGERSDGILPMGPTFATAPTSVPVLPTALFGGTTYALTARASGTQPQVESIAIRHGLTGLAFVVDTWLTPPSNAVADHTMISWDAGPLATFVVVEVWDPTSQAAQRSLQIRVFDGSSSVAIPSGIVPTGTQTTVVTAIHGNLDLTDLAIDRDRPKIDAMSSETVDMP